MAIQIRPSELRTLSAAFFKARTPFLVTGAPGIGKTTVLEDGASDLGYHRLLSHPAVEDPTDSGGMPWITDGIANFVPIGQFREAIEATEPTVWIWDDFGQATPAVQAAKMQILLAREIRGHRLPECVTICAATNRRTDRSGVTGLLEAVKSRFGTIVELIPDLDEWCTWAIDHDVNPLIIACLRFKPELLSNFVPSADLVNCPSPRTWNFADRILKMSLPTSLQYTALCGAIGEGAATELSAFMRSFAELPNMDLVIMNPQTAPIPKSPAVLYSLATALAYRATTQNFAQVSTYLQRVVDAGYGEFAVLTVKDTLRKLPEVTTTNAFVKLVTSDFGKLISGLNSAR